MAAEILEPQQCDNNYSLTVGSSPNQVQYGRTIKIEATVNEEVTHFSSWYAPNTLINGSNSASDQFVFSASTTIVPSSISTTELTIHRGSSTMDVTWKGTGEYADLIALKENTSSKMVLEGPVGALVELEYKSLSPLINPSGWYWSATDTFTYGGIVTVKLGECDDLEVWGFSLPLSGTWDFTATSTGMGLASVNGDSGSSAPFLSSATTINPVESNYNGPPLYVRFEAQSMAGWQFKQWSNSSVVPSYLARYDNVLVPLSLEAEFIEMQTIIVESEIVNTYETDARSCAGYCQVTPAKKYYRSPTTVILNDFDWGANPEIIRVEATPREGFFFGWWEGDAWYYTEGQIVNPGDDAPFAVKDNQQPKCLSDSDEQNRVTQRTIFIQTANNNKQATSPTVRAWFHPCVHCGEPSNYGAGGTVGELKGSTPLSLTGSGYSAYSANRYGCLYWILQKIDDIGREWNATYCDRPIGIGRISPQFGGQSTGNSHQNGLDVDVRYVRKQGTGALNVRTDPNDYDFEATQALVDLFVSEGATLIVYYEHIDDVSALNTGTARELRDSPLHDDHFHVRFENPVENPPGRGDCISCPSLSQGLCD